MFVLSRKEKSLNHIADMLYEAALEQARQPVFYRNLFVPDTVDGRFEMITLHVFMIMQGLKAQSYEGTVLIQPLFDTMFRDIERAGREMGIGDLSIPRQMKRMMEGFHGRMVSYEKALEESKERALQQALECNLYGTVECPEQSILSAVASYVRDNTLSLQTQDISAGQVVFTSTIIEGALL